MFEWQGELVVNWAPTGDTSLCTVTYIEVRIVKLNSKNTNGTCYTKHFSGGCQLLSMLSAMCFSMVQMR